MRPTVPELVTGVADALEGDVVAVLSDVAARGQVIAAVALLRRVARLIPYLPANLLADCDDMAAALTMLAPHIDARAQQRVDVATAELVALDPRRATLGAIDDVHQLLLGVLDAVIDQHGGDPSVDRVVQPLLEQMVRRERDVGASIEGPLASHAHEVRR